MSLREPDKRPDRTKSGSNYTNLALKKPEELLYEQSQQEDQTCEELEPLDPDLHPQRLNGLSLKSPGHLQQPLPTTICILLSRDLLPQPQPQQSYPQLPPSIFKHPQKNTHPLYTTSEILTGKYTT
jgi:hypothetical protein